MSKQRSGRGPGIVSVIIKRLLSMARYTAMTPTLRPVVLSGAIAFLTIVLLLHPAAPRAARFVAAQGPSISTLSDEFRDSASLGEWKQHDAIEGWPSQLLALDVNTTSPGHLYMEPFTSVWYAGFRAPFLFKEVSGNFVVTTRVLVSGRAAAFPEGHGSLSGLLIRQPRSGPAETWRPEDENYVSLTTGRASGPGGGGPALEITVTTRGHSQLEWQQSRDAWVELQVAHIGPNCLLLFRFEGEGWLVSHLNEPAVLGRYGGMSRGLIVHPGIGTTLQVGVTAMTDWDTIRARFDGLSATAPFRMFNSTVVKPPDGAPDLRARFNYVRFRALAIPPQFAQRRLTDLTAPEIVSMLGD